MDDANAVSPPAVSCGVSMRYSPISVMETPVSPQDTEKHVSEAYEWMGLHNMQCHCKTRRQGSGQRSVDVGQTVLCTRESDSRSTPHAHGSGGVGKQSTFHQVTAMQTPAMQV